MAVTILAAEQFSLLMVVVLVCKYDDYRHFLFISQQQQPSQRIVPAARALFLKPSKESCCFVAESAMKKKNHGRLIR